MNYALDSIIVNGANSHKDTKVSDRAYAAFHVRPRRMLSRELVPNFRFVHSDVTVSE